MDNKSDQEIKTNKRKENDLDCLFSLILIIYEHLIFYALILESIVYIFKLFFFNIADCISDAMLNSDAPISQIHETCWSIGYNPSSHYRIDYLNEVIFVRKSSFNETIEKSIETFVQYNEETEIILLDFFQICSLFILMLCFLCLSRMRNGIHRSLNKTICIALQIILVCSLKMLIFGQFSFSNNSSEFDSNKLFESTVNLDINELINSDYLLLIPIEKLDSSIKLYNAKLSISSIGFFNCFVLTVFCLLVYFTTLLLILFIIIKIRDLTRFLSNQSSINLMPHKFNLIHSNYLKEYKIFSIDYKLIKANPKQQELINV